MTGQKTGAKESFLWRWLSALGFLPPPARPKRRKKRVVLKKGTALSGDDGGALETQNDLSPPDLREYMAPQRGSDAAAASPSRSLQVDEPVRGVETRGLFDADALRQIDALFEGLEDGTGLPLPGLASQEEGLQTQERDEQSFFGEFGHIASTDARGATLPLTEAQPDFWQEARIPLPVDPFASGSSAMEFSEWPPARLLTLDAATDLSAFLGVFSGVSGVAGAMAIGRDGLIIDCTLDDTWDAEYIGAQACTLFVGNQGQLLKMDYGDLRRLILETDIGTLVVLACDAGFVAVIAERQSPMAVGAILSLVSRL